MINATDADLVAVVGDLVDGSVAELGPAAEPLRDLRAQHGSFFVTGNHEYFSGFRGVDRGGPALGLTAAAQRAGRDRRARPGRGERRDRWRPAATPPDYAAALGDRDASRPVVLLAHQPVQADEAAKHGVDLQLSGHTHGGQMVPFNLVVGLQQPIVVGLRRRSTARRST